MKPFGVLVAERSNNLVRCVEQSNRFLQRYKDRSGNTKVDLDEVAWIFAIVHVGMREALEQQSDTVTKNESVNENGARVVTVVAQSEAQTHDEAG